jgi:hypothetical protein
MKTGEFYPNPPLLINGFPMAIHNRNKNSKPSHNDIIGRLSKGSKKVKI